VFSQGQPVIDRRQLYIWHPDLYDGRPFYASPDEVSLEISEGAKIRVASKVEDYVPYFEEEVTLSSALVASKIQDKGDNDDAWSLNSEEFEDYRRFVEDCNGTALKPQRKSKAPKAKPGPRARATAKRQKCQIQALYQPPNPEEQSPDCLQDLTKTCPTCSSQLAKCKRCSAMHCQTCTPSLVQFCQPCVKAGAPRTPSKERVQLGENFAQKQMEANSGQKSAPANSATPLRNWAKMFLKP